MKSTIFIALFIVQIHAISWSDIISPVEDRLNRLVEDVVAIRDNIDCTISAVEQVFTLGGLFGTSSDYYDEKCGDRSYDNNYDDNSDSFNDDYSYTTEGTTTPQAERKYISETKEMLSEEINKSVSSASEHIQNILDQNNSKQQIENVENTLRIETDRLGQISTMLRREVERLPDEIRKQLSLDRDYKAVDDVLQEVRLLYQVEQKDKSGAAANEVRRIFDKILNILGVPDDGPFSDEDEVKLIIRHLDKTCNGTIVNAVHQVSLWTRDGEKPITNIENVVLNINETNIHVHVSQDKNRTQSNNSVKLLVESKPDSNNSKTFYNITVPFVNNENTSLSEYEQKHTILNENGNTILNSKEMYSVKENLYTNQNEKDVSFIISNKNNSVVNKTVASFILPSNVNDSVSVLQMAHNTENFNEHVKNKNHTDLKEVTFILDKNTSNSVIADDYMIPKNSSETNNETSLSFDSVYNIKDNDDIGKNNTLNSSVAKDKNSCTNSNATNFSYQIKSVSTKMTKQTKIVLSDKFKNNVKISTKVDTIQKNKNKEASPDYSNKLKKPLVGNSLQSEAHALNSVTQSQNLTNLDSSYDTISTTTMKPSVSTEINPEITKPNLQSRVKNSLTVETTKYSFKNISLEENSTSCNESSSSLKVQLASNVALTSKPQAQALSSTKILPVLNDQILTTTVRTTKSENQQGGSNSGAYSATPKPNYISMEPTTPETEKPDEKSEPKTRPIPKNFKEAAQQILNSKPLVYMDYLYDENNPEQADTFIKSFFGSMDKHSAHEALQNALGIMEQSEKTRSIMDNIFNDKNLDPAPSVFDYPEYLDY